MTSSYFNCNNSNTYWTASSQPFLPAYFHRWGSQMAHLAGEKSSYPQNLAISLLSGSLLPYSQFTHIQCGSRGQICFLKNWALTECSLLGFYSSIWSAGAPMARWLKPWVADQKVRSSNPLAAVQEKRPGNLLPWRLQPRNPYGVVLLYNVRSLWFRADLTTHNNNCLICTSSSAKL